MTTTLPKKQQQWCVVYHLGCHGAITDGAIPADIIHVTDPQSDLAAAQKHMRNNPMPPEETLRDVHRDDLEKILLSAVQVRGPKQVVVKKHLESL